MKSSLATLLLPIVLLYISLGQASGETHSHEMNFGQDDGPRMVVERWIRLVESGNSDEAGGLTTGAEFPDASQAVEDNEGNEFQVERSLGSNRAAAVIMKTTKGSETDDEVLLFWLVRKEMFWRINKAQLVAKHVVDERLRGFLEAQDVQWHIHTDEVVGTWSSSPCKLPFVESTACGGDFTLEPDNNFRLIVMGPGGPVPGAIEGEWHVADDKLVLSVREQAVEFKVTWLNHEQLVLEWDDRAEENSGSDHQIQLKLYRLE